ncbi:hypothetical protein O6H91_19G058300 [Diphasiastrum complanatum]|uniref:Uncharacterized protein n=9 Tax=Diphasiastrum complanatum TaxID=34168 RepID=A0ACC2AWB9_DIPCM|nr:hypothetical protein O6H91_19G058300 [Diphasiastrum complanatum]KAJ7521526.1 hypothetical protein O6H91_19G058300 [Diphasiastrum complanatum]
MLYESLESLSRRRTCFGCRSMCLEMDLEEARRKLYTRVQSLDADNVLKIMGYLLLQDWEEQEMLRLALGSDIVLHSLIAKAKKELGLTSVTKPIQYSSPLHSPRLSTPNRNIALRASQQLQLGCSQFSPSETSYRSPDLYAIDKSSAQDAAMAVAQRTPLDLSNLYDRFAGNERFLIMKDSQLSCSIPLLKPCLYFARGYCKNGNACRFVHEGERASLAYFVDASQKTQETDGTEGVQLECLEKELSELLRGKAPVSMASLPQLYHERYGKLLHAEECYSEGQRQVNSDNSLSNLLAGLPNIVTLVDWPYGQQAVVLTEEAYKFRAYRGSALENDSFNSSSRQIYLTFPAESTFTMQDVSIHFRAYGPVQDVRIPTQQKRMFGFVTFTYSETVRTVLSEGNPHYICGARVLVKPYKEKAKLAERKYLEKMELLKNAHPCSMDRNHQFEALKIYNQVLGRQIMHEELEPLTALQWRLAQLNLEDHKKHIMEEETLNTSTQVKQAPSTYEQAQFIDDHRSNTEEKLYLHSSQYDWVLDVLNTSEVTDEVNGSDIFQNDPESKGIHLPSISCSQLCDLKSPTSPTLFRQNTY